MRGFSVSLWVFLIILSFALPLRAKETSREYNPQVAERIFERSVRKFFDAFDQDDFLKRLEKLEDGKNLKEKQFKKFKKIRLKAQRIRAVYEFFDRRHTTPEAFDYFVIQYGKLKDALVVGANYEPYLLNLKIFLMQNNLTEILSDFQPTSFESYSAYLRDRFDKFEKWSKKNQLSLKKYHKLRKGLRGLYFVIKSIKSDEEPAEDLALQIKTLENAMGIVNDRLQQKEMLSEYVPEKIGVPVAALGLITKSRQVLLTTRSCRKILGPKR